MILAVFLNTLVEAGLNFSDSVLAHSEFAEMVKLLKLQMSTG